MPRCPACGTNNAAGASVCSICQHQFPQPNQRRQPRQTPPRSGGTAPTATPTPNPPPVHTAQRTQPSTQRTHHQSQPSPQSQRQPQAGQSASPSGSSSSGSQGGFQPVSGQVINRFFNPPPQLDGTVISVDAPFDEPPDFDIAKTTFGCMVLFPVLPFVIALAIFLSFFRVNVLQWLGILHLFGFSRAPTQKQEPVRNFRIRDTNGTEHQIKMKGHLKVGNAVHCDFSGLSITAHHQRSC
jgi:hypothetical protein